MTDQQTPFQLITAKYLIDGNGGAPIENGAVLLEGTKVRAVGPEHTVTVPEGAAVESHAFPEGTVLPGLVDVHTHLNYPGDGTHTNDVMSEDDDILLMQSILNARNYLDLGVTTIRDNGAKNNTTLSLKEGIRRGLAVGAAPSALRQPSHHYRWPHVADGRRGGWRGRCYQRGARSG